MAAAGHACTGALNSLWGTIRVKCRANTPAEAACGPPPGTPRAKHVPKWARGRHAKMPVLEHDSRDRCADMGGGGRCSNLRGL
eukprot:9476828-Pyramimonas_sp.AAC.1